MDRANCPKCDPERVCRVAERQALGALDLFSSTARGLPREAHSTTLVMVTHALADNALLVRFLVRYFGQVLVVPKPESICRQALADMSRAAQVIACGREALAKPGGTSAIERLVGPDRRLVIADMGGYFAPALPDLSARWGSRLTGVVEDTTNGHLRYDGAQDSSPVLSLARSAIKLPEDVVVGQTIAQALIKTLSCTGSDPARLTYLVLGFGRVGRSAAEQLSRCGMKVAIYDPDPLRQLEAGAAGLEIASRAAALRNAHAIVCASGNRSLSTGDLAQLRVGCVVAAATSADDEFDFRGLDRRWRRLEGPADTLMLRGKDGRHAILFVNQGNAANFRYGAVVGPAIHLVHAALIMSLGKLLRGECRAGLIGLPMDDQREIAARWRKCFPDEQDLESICPWEDEGGPVSIWRA